MGAIQNALDQVTNTALGVAAVGKHIGEEKKQTELKIAETKADIAATKEKKAGLEKDYRNDTIEAAIAINAHERDKFDPVIGGKHLSELSAKEKAEMSDDDVKTLAGEVKKIREGKLTEDRIGRMDRARSMHWTDSRDTTIEEKMTRKNKKKAALKKAYEAFDELNDRIVATRTLKFDIDAAQAKIDQLTAGLEKVRA